MGADGSVLDGLLEVAKELAPLIHPAAPALITVGEKLVATIDRAAAQMKGELPPRLREERDALEARVRAHTADVVKRLRGEG